MNKDRAIQMLERMQNPEPYDPQITSEAFDALQMAIDALSADGDTISRTSLMSELKDMHHEAEKWIADAKNDDVKARAESCLVTITEIKLRVDKMPSAQPKRIEGHWIDGESQCGIKCSKCGCPVDDFCHSIDYIDLDYAPNFCPNCGSDNREVTT